MPISIDEFESHDGRGEPTNAERVLRFLVRNRDQAFKAAEIAERAGVNANSIHPVLRRLEERELVRHKPPYWALGDPETVRNASIFRSTAAFLDEELGAESRSEWVTASHDGEDGEDGE